MLRKAPEAHRREPARVIGRREFRSAKVAVVAILEVFLSTMWTELVGKVVLSTITQNLLSPKDPLHKALDKGDYAYREGVLHNDKRQLKNSIDHYVTASNEGAMPLRHYAQAMKIFAREELNSNKPSHIQEAYQLLQEVGKDNTSLLSLIPTAFGAKEENEKNQKRKTLLTHFLHSETLTEPFLQHHIPAASSPLIVYGYDLGNFQVVDFGNLLPKENYLDECRQITRVRGGSQPSFWHALYYYPTLISALLILLPIDQARQIEMTLYRNNMHHLKHSMVMDAMRTILTDQYPRLAHEFGSGLENRQILIE